MTNQLIKNTNITYTPGSPGVAANPGQPGYAAYTSYEQQKVCAYVVTGGSWQWVQVVNPDGGTTYQRILVPSSSGSVTGGSLGSAATSSYQCSYQSVPVYHPAQTYVAPTAGVAPTAAQTTSDYNLGWNAGARSQGSFSGDGYASFKASPTIVGVVAGLNYTDPDADYANIDYGFYISNRVVRLMEMGSTVAYIGPQVDDATYKIVRLLGTVHYYINGVLQYTSTAPSTGIVFLDVSFYSGGDYLDSPAIGGTSSTGSAPEAGGVIFVGTPGNTYLPSYGPFFITYGPLFTVVGGAVWVGMAGNTYTNGDGKIYYDFIPTQNFYGVLPDGRYVGSVSNVYVDANGVKFDPSGGTTTTDAAGNKYTAIAGAMNFLPLGISAGQGTDNDAGANMSFRSLTVVSSPYRGGTLNLLPLAMAASNYVTGQAALALAPMTLDSVSSRLTPSYALAKLPFVQMAMSGNILSGQISAVIKNTVSINADGSITVVVFGPPGSTVQVTFPNGATVSVVIGADGTGTVTSAPSQPLGSTTVVASVDGVPQTTTVTTNANGSITVTGTGAVGAPVTVTFPSGSVTTTVGANGTYTATSSVSQPTGAIGVTVGLTGSLVMRPMTMLAGRAGYGEARMAMAPPAMYASAYEGNLEASIRELVISSPTLSYIGFVDVNLFSSAMMQDSMYVLVLKDAAMPSSVTVGDTMTYSAIMEALMRIDLRMFAGIPVLTDSGEVWVVNDESGASSRYENYSFNSFGKYQDKYMGAKADGVYLLEGAADVATPVRSSISLGQQDFGSTLAKTVTDCYIGLAASGNVFLRVTANGQTYTYRTSRSTSHLDTQRVSVGKGLRANYITFEIYNEAGADFELASVEFQAATLSRRI